MNSRNAAPLDRWNKTRDADAFSEIVSRHSGMVYGACLRILQDPAAAEDVSQECFIELATGRTRIRTALGGWLHKAATNRSLNRLRAEKRRKEREKRFVQKYNSHAEPTWNDIQGYVDEAIAALPDGLRGPIVAHFFEGQTYDAIASETGAPRSTVASRVQRGISLIRKTLNQKGISASVAAVAAALAQGTAEAAPAPLTIALAKLAIAGPSTAAKWTAIGATGLMIKKIFISVGIAILLLLGAYRVAFRPEDRGPAENQPAAVEVAASTEQPSEYAEQEDHAEVESSAPAARPVALALAQEQETIPEEEAAASPPLEPASVSGHVMDDEGYPVEGALIQLEVTQDPSHITVLKTYTARTGGKGRYAITGIETFGHAAVFASAEGCVMGKNSVMEGIGPGTKSKGVDFTLQKARHFVAGRVVTESGQSVPGATVQLRYYGYNEEGIQYTAETGGTTGTISDSKSSFASSDREGYFMIAVAREGLCDFTVTASDHAPAFFAGIPTGTEDALFALPASGAISGRVSRQDGSAVPGAQVEVVGYALPGGLEPSDIRIQTLRLPAVAGLADEAGRYEVGALSVDYVYRVSAGAQETGETAREDRIRVRAGETTGDVDLVLGGRGAVVHGKVTVARTGQPVHPFGVFASRADAESPVREILGTMANTDTEGRYELTLPIDELTAVRVFWRYVHSAGYGPFSDDSEIATLELWPGAKEELNFSIEAAPFSVIMRFVDKQGRPMTDVRAGIQIQDRGMGWQGSAMASDEEGLVAWHGLIPGETYLALGLNQDGRWIGRSSLFSGEPAETDRDVVVVCAHFGGFEGILIDNEGRPISEAPVGCLAVRENGALLDDAGRKAGNNTTNENGAFVFLDAFQEGEYPTVFVVAQPDEESDELCVAELSGLVIGADTIADVGTLSGRTLSRAEFEAMLR